MMVWCDMDGDYGLDMLNVDYDVSIWDMGQMFEIFRMYSECVNVAKILRCNISSILPTHTYLDNTFLSYYIFIYIFALPKLRTSSFAYLYVPKVYFDFAICLFNLYVIVGVEYI